MKNIQSISLPLDGFSRWKQIEQFLPVSRETWRAMRKNGSAPKEIRLSARCVMYSNAEIHKFLADITNYKAQEAK